MERVFKVFKVGILTSKNWILRIIVKMQIDFYHIHKNFWNKRTNWNCFSILIALWLFNQMEWKYFCINEWLWMPLQKKFISFTWNYRWKVWKGIKSFVWTFCFWKYNQCIPETFWKYIMYLITIWKHIIAICSKLS